MKNTVKIYIQDAPSFTRELVVQGLTFEAVQEGSFVVFTLTGGY